MKIQIQGVLVAGLCAGALLAQACSDDAKKDNEEIVDAAVETDAFESTCGFPGDEGNELGVGKFCMTSAECAGNTGAPLCSTLGANDTFFCTNTCDPKKDVVEECGTDTTCACRDVGCGCRPNSCVAQ